MKTQIVVLTTLALCACADNPDRSQEHSTLAKAALTEKTPTYCKETDHRSRRLLATSIADAETSPGRSYEIRDSYGHIAEDDRFYLEQSRGVLKLIHQRMRGNTYEPIAESDLTLDASALWFKGTTSGSDELEAGEYFVYQIPSSGSDYSEHDKCARTGSTTPCKSFHFEFYAVSDTGSRSHKPEIGRNVFPWTDDGTDSCKSRPMQTGSGDGEDGTD